MRARVVGTKSHYRTVRALANALEAHLADSGFEVYRETVRLRVAESARLPDVMVTCDARDHADPLLVRYPKFIAEFLSESTATTDLTEKLAEYCAIDSLQEYLVLDGDARRAYLHRRGATGWNTPVTFEADSDLELLSLDFRCKLALLFG